MFSDQELLKQLLLRPQHPLVGILDGPLRRKVTASVALLMLKGGIFEWCGSTRRVRKMRLVNKPTPVGAVLPDDRGAHHTAVDRMAQDQKQRWLCRVGQHDSEDCVDLNPASDAHLGSG